MLEYSGGWKDGKYHGQGKCKWCNGEMYDGAWKDGKRNGKGNNTFPTGDVVEGEWKNDKPLGGQSNHPSHSENHYSLINMHNPSFSLVNLGAHLG